MERLFDVDNGIHNHSELIDSDDDSILWTEKRPCKSKTVDNAFTLLNYLLNDNNAPIHVGLCPDGDIAFDFKTRGGNCNATVDDKEGIGFAYIDYSGKLVATEFLTPKELSDKLDQIDSEPYFEER